ncbi:6-phosphogluconolactonase [Bowmanella sp. JS7-9]|uniref:6-phosphogluconolactonase n=1 Tax=Pseudobowmanella zhangzhouensis TaxID=1537679 RepID=A0ABW1XJU5_9ALTE|nr:6-phosphogluconolactonase [Bowmanella sp. JS7-9]TBX27330.1 6-phosphogluconolactonase [Bowmanella sp. JS7-9]
MRETHYATQQELNEQFAARIAHILQNSIARQGRASLLVSGGRTPVGLFEILSQADVDWSNVDVSLADERWVSADDEASNEKLVRTHLLKNNAAAAHFVSLTTTAADANDAITEVTERVNAMARPFDVLILGMGEDGHTASLFPCSEQIKAGLDMHSGQTLIAVQPTTAPHQRISLTLPALLNSRNIFLHLTGDKKKAVLDQALSADDSLEMPIRAVLQNADVELIWAA